MEAIEGADIGLDGVGGEPLQHLFDLSQDWISEDGNPEQSRGKLPGDGEGLTWGQLARRVGEDEAHGVGSGSGRRDAGIDVGDPTDLEAALSGTFRVSWDHPV
jgi:hypothetical protein